MHVRQIEAAGELRQAVHVQRPLVQDHFQRPLLLNSFKAHLFVVSLPEVAPISLLRRGHFCLKHGAPTGSDDRHSFVKVSCDDDRCAICPHLSLPDHFHFPSSSRPLPPVLLLLRNMAAITPIRKPKIVKKHVKKFKRHQSDRYLRVHVSHLGVLSGGHTC